MGIDGTNNSNSIDRVASFKNAAKPINKTSEEKSEIISDKPKQSISSFKFPALSVQDKAQVLKSSENIANARGADELNTVWASKGADHKFDPISVENSSIKNLDQDIASSALAQLESISNDVSDERSDSLNVIFDITKEGFDN
jgi:hypothetical protein